MKKTKYLPVSGIKHMEQIKHLMETRLKNLFQIKHEKEKALSKTPEGTLRVCRRGSRVQYYHRNDPKDFNGTYIRGKDIKLAQRLAQKDYDQKVLCAAEQEIKAIQKCLSNYPTRSAEEIYENLHKERQKLISPIEQTNSEYVKKWEEVEYQGKNFYEGSSGFCTEKGEKVRSKSELIIANLLQKEGVPYRYEYPIYLNGMGMIHPDFTVLNVNEKKEFYWEHFGMMDDWEYVEKAIKKLAAYEQNGIFPGEKLIITYETRRNPISQKLVELMISHYLH